MSELQKRLDLLFTKLDRMALMVEQHLTDMLHAMGHAIMSEADSIIKADEEIDHLEVEIERECIRLLALYQPAAVDLRKICFVIKANNDLERIADNSVASAKMLRTLIEEQVSITALSTFKPLADLVVDALNQTLHLLTLKEDISLPYKIISNDHEVVDQAYKVFLQEVFLEGNRLQGKINAVYAMTSIGRSLERIGDLCVHIAEDTVFLQTGEIVRHTARKHESK